MLAYFRLGVFQNGKPVRAPVLVTDVALREALLLASGFDETRVGFICKTLEEKGRCEMANSSYLPRYVIEKVLAS